LQAAPSVAASTERFAEEPERRYMEPMKPAAVPRSSLVWLTGAALALAALTGLAFAGWLDHGPRMFLALAESGLAWCF
jgi:hypothetical protein